MANLSEPWLPLAGIHVVDFSMFVPGPFASSMLADLGADVIKVEPPRGDPGRSYVPVQFQTENRNKRSIALDLKSADAPTVVEKLVKQAPEEDFYLLRLISEHPRSNAKTLNKLAKHPYGAIRENVARHPNADAATLAWLSRDRSQPLWYLVAFNPNTPTPLQRRLRDRLKRLGESQPSK